MSVAARTPPDNVAIDADGLSKRYRLGTNRSLDDGLRELMDRGLRRLMPGQPPSAGDFDPDADPRARHTEFFWALDDISFQLEKGTALGLVGRNGAGKSTLLKLLGRITPPTRGSARIQGRVASLLEVGTGFQADLTGRENIFLNGAILGMKRAEVRARFDDIVGFAEVGRFIDTPIKRYSSGMFTRLAFSVAAHLKAEILLVDEVLAVGDVAFQRRCLDKMDEMAHAGRTLMFVSHRLGAVRRLCERALYLRAGRLVAEGPTQDVLASYVRDSVSNIADTHDGLSAVFEQWHFEGAGSTDPHACVSGEDVCIAVSLQVQRPLDDVTVQVQIWGDGDEVIMGASSRDDGGSALRLSVGPHVLRMKLRMPLIEGQYTMELSLSAQRARVEERVELPPRLVILPRGETALARHDRGVVDEAVHFEVDSAEDDV